MSVLLASGRGEEPAQEVAEKKRKLLCLTKGHASPRVLPQSVHVGGVWAPSKDRDSFPTEKKKKMIMCNLYDEQ